MATARVKAPTLRTWARRLSDQHPDLAPLDLVGALVSLVAGALGASSLSSSSKSFGAAGGVDSTQWRPPPGGWANPWLPGLVHEQAVSAEARGARGAWYTPEPVVRGLVQLATVEDRDVANFAVDPTCGGGAFLLAALDRYVSLGVPADQALAQVAGMDIDEGAVQVSRWSLELWAAANGISSGVTPDVTVGDALAAYPQHWPAVKLVVGNPPFATPLRTGAVPAEVEAFRVGREHLLGPYADLAAMHLLAAVERAAPGSVVALVQPQSTLAGRDTGALRTHLDQIAPVHALWAARESIFDAGVRACAAVLKPGAAPAASVLLANGPNVTVLPDSVAYRPESATSSSTGDWAAWPGYAARALGAPKLPSAMTGPTEERDTLRSIATATAGFRDEYYGLVKACAEWTGEPGGEPNRLLTVGGVEPLASRWGVDRCRFGGKHWLRPCIDVGGLDPKVKTWTERRLSPKVVVATQSKLLEPVIDRTGSVVPATPLLAVHAAEEDLGLVAAIFLAPPVVAWAWCRWFGSAMAVDALKLAARQVLELPLPSDRSAWEQAGRLLIETKIESVEHGWSISREAAAIMNHAYGAEDSVLDWWLSRAKTR